ncbi:hypothetical protein EP7_004346 [Isosphaeraceae bacterium EP7]
MRAGLSEKERDGFPSRAWLTSALMAFTLNGGEEVEETRASVMLLLFDFHAARMSATRAGIEAAERYRRGEL